MADWLLGIDPGRPMALSSPTPVPRPPAPPDRSNVIFSANREVACVQHKDIHGNVPVELVHTPEGVITIRRVFRLDGMLLNEEATLNGHRVPVPPPVTENSTVRPTVQR